MRILIRIDGRLGQMPGPNYDNFEAAFFEAAREIARAKGPQAAKLLETQIAVR
jgi:hypothetical protein